MNKFKKILVVCPSNMSTGGPEALHQLVQHMISLGLNAHIVYFPFGKNAKAPKAYEKYQAPVHNYEDLAGDMIVFPEIYPMLALRVKNATASLWWLSLDNFLERKNTNAIRDTYHLVRSIVRGKKPLFGAKSLRKLVHLSQTEHATQYLRSCGIQPIPLIDSINEAFLNYNYLKYKNKKQNIILYNPTKGKKVTQNLIKQFPQYSFMPLVGYSPEKMSELLFSAKIYIDFGHHPGRDRMPREAAIHGCCIITGVLGSAGNDIDLPIPNSYKLNPEDPNFYLLFGALVQSMQTEFNHHFEIFEPYRHYLVSEPAIFKQQIADYFLG